MRPLSLSSRLAAIWTTSALLLSGAGAWVYDTALQNNLRTDAEAFLRAKSHAVQTLLERPESAGDHLALRTELDWEPPFIQYSHVYVRILSADGSVLEETSEGRGELPPRKAQELSLALRPRMEFSRSGNPLLVLALPAPPQSAYVEARWIEVAMDLSRQAETLRRQRGLLWVIYGLGGLITLITSVWLSRFAIRPVQKLVVETEKLDHNHPGEFIEPGAYPSELQPLARALNILHRRVADQIQKLSRFAENLAHEMRNPLNNLIGEMELALARNRTDDEYRETLSSSLEEARDLTRLVEALLFIARAENASDSARVSLSCVDEVLADLAEIYRPVAEEKGSRLLVEPAPEVSVSADALLLRRALGNLIANAIHYSPAGSTIRIRAESRRESTFFVVEDNGPGIAVADRALVFERFYRSEAGRAANAGGTGLGLSIVRSILQLHGGSVWVDTSEMGGACFTLEFPHLPAGD